MTQHDELLARLETGRASQDEINAAAAIRDLTAKLEAERKAREAAERQRDEWRKAASIIEYSQAELVKELGVANAQLKEANKSIGLLTVARNDRATAAESRLAAVFERTRERCAKLADVWMAPIGIPEAERMKRGLAAAIRGLEPEE